MSDGHHVLGAESNEKASLHASDSVARPLDGSHSDIIVIYVGRATTRKRKQLKFRSSEKICDLTDKIQDVWKIDMDQDIVVKQPGGTSPIEPWKDLSQYNNQELVFHLPDVEQLDVYVSKVETEERMRVKCSYEDLVMDLQEKLCLTLGLTKKQSICLYERTPAPQETKNPLAYETSLCDLKSKDLVYEVKGITVYVSGVEKNTKTPLLCDEKDTVRDLKGLIISHFGLRKADKDTLDIYERTLISGNTQEPLKADTPLHELRSLDIVYHLTNEPLSIGLSELRSLFCGQNIGLFGAPSHGKSSTINTAAKAVNCDAVFAQTYKEHVAGTEVYTRHEIYANGDSKCMLLDVPGHSFRSFDSGGLTEMLMNVIKGKEPFGKVIGKSTGSPKPERKIHTIVSIQKGTVQIEELHRRLRDAAKSLGETIPMFVVITHIDKMTEEAVKKMIEDLQLAIGLDESVIFTVSNSHAKIGFEHIQDPQKKMYMRHVLRRVLGASNEYKKSQKVEAVPANTTSSSSPAYTRWSSSSSSRYRYEEPQSGGSCVVM